MTYVLLICTIISGRQHPIDCRETVFETRAECYAHTPKVEIGPSSTASFYIACLPETKK